MIALLRRQFRAYPWPMLLLAGAIAIVSLVMGLVPRATALLDDRQLAHSLGAVSAVQGDVTARWTTWSIASPDSPDPWSGPREAAEQTRLTQPEPLRSLLRPAQFIGRQPVLAAWEPPAGSPYYQVEAHLLIDPDLPAHSVLVDGAWPALGGDEDPFEVALTESFAKQAGLKVGDRPGGSMLVVTAIFRPDDEGDTRWEHNPYGLHYGETVSPNAGTGLLGGVFLSPQLAAGDPSHRLQSPFSYDIVYGLDARAVGSRGIDVGQLATQLTGMLAKHHSPVPSGSDDATEQNQPVAFHSELSALLTRLQASRSTTHTLIAVSAVGPIGVGIALVAMCAQLVLYRRRATRALLVARGMSPAQLTVMLTVEATAVGLPAALLGPWIAQALVPGPVSWWAWPVAALIGLVPAAALALAARRAPGHGRRELGSTAGRWLLFWEVLVGLCAAGATWRLLSTRGATGSGIDLLGVAAPILLTTLACLLALRLYPAPLRLLVDRFRRGRGFTGFMGSARALREPAGGIVPVVTIVLGTTVSVTAAALLGTISAGTERAVWAANGSSLHVSGPRISDDTATKLRAIDGVDSVALVSQVSDNSALNVGGRDVRVRVWLSDGELDRAYSLSRDGSPLPSSLFSTGSPVPVLVGGAETPTAGTGTLAGVGKVRLVGHLGLLPGVTDGSAWALVAAQNWPAGQRGHATIALIAARPGADLDRVSAEVTTLLPGSRITTTAPQLEALRAEPTVAGLSSLFILLTVVTGVVMVLAVLTGQIMTAEDRRASAAVLRTLGLSQGQLRAMTAWEMGPVVVLALLLGVGVGIALAALMLASVDFTALTGGTIAPPLHLDPWWVGGVTGGLLLVSAATVAVSSWLAGRASIAEELRRGEET